jgi:uncharacterized membrane protein YgaE (UPF0421/DUF939 family)
MKLLPSTRHAVQAMTAVAAVYALAAQFPQLERPYWAVGTALVVLCQTWSESFKKAAQRVAATFFGLLAAVVLCRFFESQPMIEAVAIFACIFLFSYSVAGSYLWAIFWMSIMVIMMFQLLGRMDHHLILERMIETLLGAVMAVLVSTFVFPVRAVEQLRSDVPEFLRMVKKACEGSLNVALGMGSEGEKPAQGKLLGSFNKVQDEFLTRQRETFLLRREPSQLRRWIFGMEMLMFYTSDLHHAVLQIQGDLAAVRINNEILQLRDGISSALDQLAEYPHGHEPVQVADTEEVRGAIREKLTPMLKRDDHQRGACLSIFPVIYYADKIYGVLKEMASIANTRKR